MKKIITILMVLFTAQAIAETIDFNGTVTTSCQFSNQVSGTLMNEVSDTTYKLSTDAIGGSRASFDLAYTGAPTLTIQAPVSLTNFPNGTPTINNIITGINFDNNANNSNAITAGANNFNSGIKSVTLDSNSTTDTATVKLIASALSAFPVGSYSAQVTLTCQ